MTNSKGKKPKRKDAEELEFDICAAKHFVELRKQLGLTQTDLIDFLTNEHGETVDQSTIYRWENGKTQVPHAVCLRLEMYLDELKADNQEKITKELVFSKKQTLVKRTLSRMNDFISKL